METTERPSLAQTLRTMNEEEGAKARGETPPSQQNQPPAQQQQTPAQQQNQQAAQQQQQSAAPNQTQQQAPAQQQTQQSNTDTNKKPADPPFVKQPAKQTQSQQAAEGQPATGKQGQETGKPSTEGSQNQQQAAADANVEPFNTRLSELTGGAIKNEEDFGRLIEQYNALQEQVQQGVKPQFKDKRAQVAFQIVSGAVGQEPEAAMRMLRAMTFNPEGKSAKDILFHAYIQDPANSDLSESDARNFFEAEFAEKYKDVENNLVTKRALDRDVNNAKKSHAEFKAQVENTKEEQAQATVSKEIESKIVGAVDGFGGVKLSFSDNPQETELLTVPIEDPAELEAIKAEILNPHEAWNELTGQFDYQSPQGFTSLVQEVWERKNHVKLRQFAFDHGFKLGQIAKVNEVRNSSNPKEISTLPAQQGSAPAKGFFDTWSDAIESKKTGS